jgi:hypothetical protein
MKKQIFIIAAILFALQSCKKEPLPTYFGKWETVQAFGVAYEYTITQGGQFCYKAPEVFGQTSFCYDFSPTSNTELIVNGNQVANWHWEFICPDVADVLVTLDDSTKQRIILKKVE